MEKVIRRKPLGSSLIFYSLERIIAFSERGNSALQHGMENNGFQQKGVLRRSIFRDGQWRDILIFGDLRKDTNAGLL